MQNSLPNAEDVRNCPKQLNMSLDRQYLQTMSRLQDTMIRARRLLPQELAKQFN